MCTAFIKNGKSPIVGFNLDILDMQHRVNAGPRGVFIEIWDAANGWLPIFGVNCRGDFVAMPTCHPYDARSDQKNGQQINALAADIDLLQNKPFAEVRTLAEAGGICSLPGGHLSDAAQRPGRQCAALHTRPGL